MNRDPRRETSRHVSPAHEDYLEAIVELASGDGSVRSVDVATKLDVSKASVNKAAGALKAAGLIAQEPYGDIILTPEGRTYGEKVLERHLALKSFLVNSLGVDEATAEAEACHMEHIISDETMEKWVAFAKRTARP